MECTRTNAHQGDGKLSEVTGEEAISIMSLKVIETSQSNEVTDAARFGEEVRKNRTRHSEVEKTVEFLNAKQSKLLAQMERMQNLRIGVPEEIQVSFFQDVMILNRKISGAETGLIEAGEETNGQRWTAGRRMWKG